MPRPYPAGFRARAIALVRAGKPQKQTAHDLGITRSRCRSGSNKTTSTEASRPGVPMMSTATEI